MQHEVPKLEPQILCCRCWQHFALYQQRFLQKKSQIAAVATFAMHAGCLKMMLVDILRHRSRMGRFLHLHLSVHSHFSTRLLLPLSRSVKPQSRCRFRRLSIVLVPATPSKERLARHILYIQQWIEGYPFREAAQYHTAAPMTAMMAETMLMYAMVVLALHVELAVIVKNFQHVILVVVVRVLSA